MAATFFRETIKSTPLLGDFTTSAARRYRTSRFPGSVTFWERHYAAGRNSGHGSRGHLAEFKAAVISDLCSEWGIESAIEWGCGDGNQLAMLDMPGYIGLDVSRTAIEGCIRRFAGDTRKSFFWYDSRCFQDQHGIFSADLALSLDVIYHLIEDATFQAYMRRLFQSARQYVLIYSSDIDLLRQGAPHVRDRKFSDWVAEYESDWHPVRTIENQYPYSDRNTDGSLSNFYCYRRDSRAAKGISPSTHDEK